MTKAELIAEAAQQSGNTKRKTEEILNALLCAMESSLMRGEKVQIVGFGSFEVKDRASRVGRNMVTGGPVEIAPSKGIQFKAGQPLKDKVNQEPQ